MGDEAPDMSEIDSDDNVRLDPIDTTLKTKIDKSKGERKNTNST